MNDKKPVLVTTRVSGLLGIFFGWVDPDADLSKDKIRLLNSRNVRYLNCNQGGVLGTAVYGPEQGSKVGPVVGECFINNITSITICSDAAVKLWEAAKWN